MNKEELLASDWPRKPGSTNMFLCTKEKPMPMPYSSIRGAGSWEHDDVRETDADSDNYIEYKCHSCGHVWRVEMPE